MVCLCAGHTEKIYWVRYHPLAKDILATASYDMTVRIWDVAEAEEWLQLEGHTDTVGMTLGHGGSGRVAAAGGTHRHGTNHSLLMTCLEERESKRAYSPN